MILELTLILDSLPMKNRKKIHIYSGLLVLGVIVCIVFFIRSYQLYISRTWNYEGNFAVLNPDELTVTVYMPARESLYTIVLPGSAYVTVPGGYGMYRLEDVRELSMSEKQGDRLLSLTVTASFGLPVMATRESLSIADRVLIFLAEQYYSGRRESLSLADATIFDTETRLDGEQIERLDQYKRITYFAELFWEEGIVNEGLAVGIFNASDTPGLAASLTQSLETIGIRVIDSANWGGAPVSDTCIVRISEAVRSSVTANRLRSFLTCREEILASDDTRFAIRIIVNDVPFRQ
ncbi:hypothetical protein A3B56_00625 [Candidatus Roizmanbacteria bacterium RIFCSPLOWO2_01_FULL_45_11]|uniref:LytR/CpsA/Psr regulator C-terminal domain-containing protein n=1 Tax=Candidatus Roizmanbacteria bacterium RIFCSPLOWO2_01_FULL_45_11 TaxID=1802070 RepID=A0A1F7JGH7_9BACT|nr:MAG: hypothetical protein A3B56_00625 [Candidatus Roizmanbacteria bacterium RIFCSPLOWO2_01_FULL_45_11]